MSELKVALFYDWINQWGGAEKVLLDLIKLYPEAPVFTLVYDPKKTDWLPKKTKIIPSLLNKFPLSKKNPFIYTPLYPLFLEQFDFSEYDVVISTTSTIGHCLLTPTKTLFVCYCHNINRYLYQTPKNYRFLQPILNKYQSIDKIYSHRPDYYLCNSKTVQKRIYRSYKRKADIIYPGINLNKLAIKNDSKSKDFFLVVSRLVPHKRVDLAIKACHRADKKLIIVGDGRQKKSLENLVKKLNTKNVVFLGQIPENDLINLYQTCKALICPQKEDFGLTAIEAQACGKPVIALNKAGYTETVIPDITGILFNKQSVSELTNALIKFDSIKFFPTACRNNAIRFSDEYFMLNFKQSISELWKRYSKTNIIT